MKYLILPTVGILLSSCFPLPRQEPQQKVVTKRTMHLFRVVYLKKDYPFALWEIDIVGAADGMHQKIADVPRGQIVVIDKSTFRGDFYSSGRVNIYGSTIFQGKHYNVQSSCFSEDYHNLFEDIK